MTALQVARRTPLFQNYICKLLENRAIDCDEEWWAEEAVQTELRALAGATENYVSDSCKLKIDTPETMIFVVCVDSSQSIMESIQAQAASLAKTEEISRLHLVFFARDMKNRVYLEKMFDRKGKEQLRTSLKAAGLTKRSLTINCTYILDQEFTQREDIKLIDLKRHEIMNMPPISCTINRESPEAPAASPAREDLLSALVLTVKLSQLVKIYNRIGDQLFRNNVRFGISETLGVDQSIRETLEKEPEKFWYKNNGVTILVENPDFKLKSAEELILGEIEPGKRPDFSVVNGAQTITTSARYFYELEYQKETATSGTQEFEDKLKEFERAQVLLRIIHVPDSASDAPSSSEHTATEISVALNRQKPIKVEDIVFTTPFVKKLTQYLEDLQFTEDASFYLTRRGENNFFKHQIDLIGFTRARMACAGEPGKARSLSSSSLLKFNVKEDSYSFQEKDVFVNEWLEASSKEQEDAVFQRYYNAVWFTHQVAREYETHQRKITPNDSSALTVIRNGKWYFTTFLLQLLSGFLFAEDSSPDFSAFHVTFASIRQYIPDAIRRFAEMIVCFANANDQNLDSNLFKNSTLYQDFVGALKQGQFSAEFQRFQELFHEVLPSAAPVRQPALKTNFIRLGNQQMPLQNTTQAMRETVCYILENFSPSEAQLNETCAGWLGTNRAETLSGHSFGNYPTQIEIKGTTYWLGIISNNKTKYYQLRTLCNLAQVPHNSIVWFGNSSKEPIFSW